MFEQPRGIPWLVWQAAVLELARECPPPLGLYDDPAPRIRRPDPGKPETA